MDLDHFKDVNDRYGHAGGDQVLVAFAGRLRAVARAGDLVVRLGGDEFAVRAEHDLSPEDAAVMARRLVLEAAAPFVVDTRGYDGRAPHRVLLSIGASVGIARADHSAKSLPVTALDVLLGQADHAMYRAKAHGRGRVAHFDPRQRPDTAATERERAMERRLRATLSEAALTLHYQPQVELPSGRVIGFEALARWDDPELGRVGPDEFVPLAERTGLIFDLGRWVLDTACAEAARWQGEAGGGAPTVSVNVSPLQLAQRGLVADVAKALTRSGLSAARLCIEITETAAITDLEETAGRLDELRSLGVRLALDDFGTGRSPTRGAGGRIGRGGVACGRARHRCRSGGRDHLALSVCRR